METNTQKNQRIAKNTIFLYCRMLLTMFVSLFTSRIVLQVLGAEDYGLYSLVGGIVVLLSFLNSTMSVATQRFLAYEIGRGDEKKLNETFCISLSIHIIIAIVIFLFAETIGLWFLQTQLKIPEGRMFAAHVVYQFSVASSLLGITQIPYDSIIIAREKMNVFAYMSILGVVLKLGLISLLFYVSYDKLELYAFLIFINSTIMLLICRFYCFKKFKETKFRFIFKGETYRQMVAFAGWNLVPNIVLVARTQGTNMLINIFSGLLFNTARGIAVQVNMIIMQFVANFQVAVNPQIVKSYAEGDLIEMNKLVFRSSKFSFLLLSIMVMPFIFETEIILSIWLGKVPEYSVKFTRLALVASLFDCLSGTLGNSALATGRIKKYQIVMSCVLSLCFFFSWLVLFLGGCPEYVYVVDCVIYSICMFVRLFLLKGMTDLDVKGYLKSVFARNILAIIPIVCIGCLIKTLFETSIHRLLFGGIILVLCSVVSSLYIGMTKAERLSIFNIINNKIKIWKKSV